jgi:hypothetical protein
MFLNHELARGWICSLLKMLDLDSQNPRGPYLQLVKHVDFRCNVLNIYIDVEIQDERRRRRLIEGEVSRDPDLRAPSSPNIIFSKISSCSGQLRRATSDLLQPQPPIPATTHLIFGYSFLLHRSLSPPPNTITTFSSLHLLHLRPTPASSFPATVASPACSGATDSRHSLGCISFFGSFFISTTEHDLHLHFQI